MSVRIIAGSYGGRIIDASGTSRTHPMGDRVKNAIFNSLGDRIVGARVLDTFAGSGALAFEALSRGASLAVLIEKDHIAQKIIEKNRTLLGIDVDRAKVIKGPVASVVASMGDSFDIIFADPPYHDPQAATVARLFTRLAPGGILVVSHPKVFSMEVPEGYIASEPRSYANATITTYQASPFSSVAFPQSST